MPNHCSNELNISHSDPVMIEKVIAAIKAKNLFQSFYPCPQALKDTVCGWYTDDAAQAALEQQEKDNVNTYGHKTWYEWCTTNWGTKWDIKYGRICAEDTLSVQATFDTAWAPPIEFYEKMMEMGFSIKAYYYELDDGFAGIWDNGVDDYYDDINSQNLPSDLVDRIPVNEYSN